jgi:hypothetical protein
MSKANACWRWSIMARVPTGPQTAIGAVRRLFRGDVLLELEATAVIRDR